jgi:Protein of unknown function (DUF2786)
LVSKASRLRRQAKQAKDARRAREKRRADQRAHQRAGQRQPGGTAYRRPAPGAPFSRDGLATLAEQLAAEAVNARFHGDTGALTRYAARLAEVSEPAGGQRVVDETLFRCLQTAVTLGWRQGWQPAELVRHVRRVLGDAHAGMAADAIAAELRGYAPATVDERWAAQLTALEANLWWGNSGCLERWRDRTGLDREPAIRCALEVLYLLSTLPALAQLCSIPGAARQGTLAPGRQAQPADQRMLERVRALLAKAESTEFAAEAEALTARAQELMARHSIDYAMLAATSGHAETPSGRRLFVDRPYEAPKAVLLDVVATANRCRAIWHRNLGLSTMLGFPGDLDAVELLFTSLLVQATTAMVRAGARRDSYGRSRTRSFRQSFLASYAQRIGERLAEAADAAQQQAAADSAGTNLLPVLAARDSAVDEAVADMFPGMTRSAVTSVNDQEGWLRGRAAADLAALHRRGEVAATPE